ncbi:cyclic AMP-responsive element-binding protein 3 [Calypte anna]|uniref:cyclic AMP-responsive element-binding protein 3 n=1 Tax=Calypte anna TaxID=9244 RepID=UPI0011C3C2C2|nr:cyclic AMP-responsive element-binding protein 3 [Calypte anna]
MLCPEELAVLEDEDLIDFLLSNDSPGPEITGQENHQAVDWSPIDAELLDKEIDDFMSSLLSGFENTPEAVQGLLSADGDSGFSEDQHLSQSPGNDFASSLSKGVVQADHNYSLHQDCPEVGSVRCETSEGVFIDVEAQKSLEGTSKELEENIVVTVDAGPQLEPGTFVQTPTASDFPELVLTKEEKPLLGKEGVAIPACLPLSEGEEQLLKKVRRKIRNKQSAHDSRHRKKMYMEDLENRVAACIADNRRLEKKVKLLQEENASLLQQLWKLQSSVSESITKTTAGKTCTLIMGLSFCLIVFPNVRSARNRETQLELRVRSRRIRQSPRQAAPTMQVNPVLEGLGPEFEDPLLLSQLNQLLEEEQSLLSHDPRAPFNTNLSFDSQMAAGLELGLPQPQEEHSQSNPLEAAAAWRVNEQEWVKHAAGAVFQQHHFDEM